MKLFANSYMGISDMVITERPQSVNILNEQLHKLAQIKKAWQRVFSKWKIYKQVC